MHSLWVSGRLAIAALSNQAIVRLICDMRPRRLRLPSNSDRDVISTLLQHQPDIFSKLTHIQLDWPYGLEEISLPSLTHLIIMNHAAANDGNGLCCQPVLTAVLLSKKLVVCGLVAENFSDTFMAREDYRDVEDPRFVIMTTTRYPEDDWTAEYHGQKDLFARAEDFVRNQVVSTSELTVQGRGEGGRYQF